MRRSCGQRASRNDSFGYQPRLRARENSCSASLVQERVVEALFLSLFLFILQQSPRTRDIHSSARPLQMGGDIPPCAWLLAHLPLPTHLLKVRWESAETFRRSPGGRSPHLRCPPPR